MLMTRFTTTLFALFLFIGYTFAGSDADPKVQVLTANQVSKLDLNGKWSGKRMQYSADKKSFSEIFQYEFDLVQNGDIITGTSTIIDANGNFADMMLEGVLVGNKLHFREYQVKNAIRPEGKIWCFKSGELNFTTDGDNLKLTGATASYMEIYNYPCTGGETNLTKVDNSANVSVLSDVSAGVAALADNKINIATYPNPFVDNANISYTLTTDAKVTLQVFDMQGKLITALFEGNQASGSYNLNFDGKRFASNSGIYIVKMTVNGDVYSSQMVQMR